MSKQQTLRDIQKQKCLLVAKANLQRSNFLMLAYPVFKLVYAVEVGFFAVKLGNKIVRLIKH